MFKVIQSDLAVKNEATISKIDSSKEDTLKSDSAEIRNNSSDISNTETVSYSSSILANGSSENLFEEVMPIPVTVEPVAIVTTAAKRMSLETAKPMREVEELTESINSQIEDTEEMLDMISSAKERLEFFLFHVEYLMKSLQEMSKHSTVSSRNGNTYIKRIYRQKLEEFASGLIDKIQKSIKDLQVDYKALKEQEKKTAGFFEKISEFNRISDASEIGEERVGKLKETVDHLLEEMSVLKPKQLTEIKKVSYIETDIEMLYDLNRRFSSIEGHNLISF